LPFRRTKKPQKRSTENLLCGDGRSPHRAGARAGSARLNAGSHAGIHGRSSYANDRGHEKVSRASRNPVFPHSPAPSPLIEPNITFGGGPTSNVMSPWRRGFRLPCGSWMGDAEGFWLGASDDGLTQATSHIDALAEASDRYGNTQSSLTRISRRQFTQARRFSLSSRNNHTGSGMGTARGWLA